MKLLISILAVIAVPILLTACIVFPHGELIAPPASGRLIDSETSEAVAGATVNRRIESIDRTYVAVADDAGVFVFQKDKDLRWFLLGCAAARRIDYTIQADGYQLFTTNLSGGGDFYRGTIPHDFGQIELRKASE